MGTLSMSGTKTIGVPVDEDDELYEKFEEYKEEQGIEQNSAAARQLWRKGLRYDSAWRRQTTTAAVNLSLLAVFVFMIGQGTEMMHPGRSTVLTWILLAMAGGMLALGQLLAEYHPVDVWRELRGET